MYKEVKNLILQFKMFFIFLADLAVAFGSLVLVITTRYGADNLTTQISAHIFPFLIVIFLFLLNFYIFNLYSFRFNKNTTELVSSFLKSVIISLCVTVFMFYIFGEFFRLTPKTNLVLFTLFFAAIDFYLRILIKRFFSRRNINRKVVLIAGKENALAQELERNQNTSYEIVKQSDTFDLESILSLNPDLVAIETENTVDLEKIYTLSRKNILVYTINNFYEEVFQKIPIEKISERDIIDYLSKNKTVFNFIKRIIDIKLSLILLFLLSPVFVFISFLVKTTSRGPVFIRQKRISKNGEIFTLYKFRSMIAITSDGQAEKEGAVWTKNSKNDPRVTRLGRILRETHLDEIPQLINILKGNISFIGPRPERPEFTDTLKRDILHYDLRHSVKAGLSGWAQVNFKYGSSVEDAREKLKYDFYYIKNRNIFFDFLIMLKTLAKIFS